MEKDKIEKQLKDLLYDMLRDYNQEGALISLKVDDYKFDDEITCTIKMNVTIVEEDDYVGFDGY